MKDLFHFKQFCIDQYGCGMKINTDGVLLGALIQPENPFSVLDIGTGTGVIAMMLAQRFPTAHIEAVEIDDSAATAAANNFLSSKFAERLQVFQTSFQNFSKEHPGKKYDLIVSNPPFFINSLKNPDQQKQLARHTDTSLFEDLVTFSMNHLSSNGVCKFILPVDAAKQVIIEGMRQGLHLQHVLTIRSSELKPPHRQIITLGLNDLKCSELFFTIYSSEKVYSEEYKTALKDFLTIF